jgi:serine/threonine-protein phosphatase CPPED1
MNRLLTLGLAVAVLCTASFVSLAMRDGTPAQTGTHSEIKIAVEKKNPFTSIKPNVDPNQFQFAIVSDRTGGHRAGVFSRAVNQLNLMQPEFVMSVGDLIEGSPKAEDNQNQWVEFNSYVKKLQMPFFYVPGNHDFGTENKNLVWDENFGRRYYHFVYNDCLFLALNCFDGPKVKDPLKPSAERFSAEQRQYIQKALVENPKTRWTFIFFHQPIWNQRDVDATGLTEIETMLNGRKYTVFVGHVHVYRKYIRNGMNYYQLATTGGGSAIRGPEYGEFDHITWVTMKQDGPVIANLMLDGILKEDLSPIENDELGTAGKKAANLVTGKVTKAGQPLAGIEVRFTRMDAKLKRDEVPTFGTAIVQEDGTYRIRLQRVVEGLPTGKYAVTFRQPTRIVSNPAVMGLKIPQIPEKYQSIETSGLLVEVVAGDNTIDLQMD